jgi:hypothetical protein
MTIFRHDENCEAEVLGGDVSRFHFHNVGRLANNNLESLSQISMTHYNSYMFWPLIWKLNYAKIKDPNKLKHWMTLKVLKRQYLTALDRKQCKKIFESWRDVSKARGMLRKWAEQELSDGVPYDPGQGDLLPAWMMWSGNRGEPTESDAMP